MYGMLEFEDVIYSQRTPYSKIKSSDNRNIPDKIKRFFNCEIEENMFEEDEKLLNVIIPEEVTKMGSYAFAINVKSIEFKGKVYTNKREFNDMTKEKGLCTPYYIKHKKLMHDIWVQEIWTFV